MKHFIFSIKKQPPGRLIVVGFALVILLGTALLLLPVSVKDGAEVSFINANDGTCEGVNYHNIPAFSVQFHPDAAPGPHDADSLFDDFISMVDQQRSERTNA